MEALFCVRVPMAVAQHHGWGRPLPVAIVRGLATGHAVQKVLCGLPGWQLMVSVPVRYES
jgi:hypothetical protein